MRPPILSISTTVFLAVLAAACSDPKAAARAAAAKPAVPTVATAPPVPAIPAPPAAPAAAPSPAPVAAAPDDPAAVAINSAALAPGKPRPAKGPDPLLVRAQVLLDRAHFLSLIHI